MTTIIQINLNMTKGLFNDWQKEQDTSIPYVYNAEKYLMDLLCMQLKFMTDETDDTIGKFVKEYMKFVNEELEKIKQKTGGSKK